MAAMAGVCVASGVCATLPSLASSCSSQANVVKAAPSSLLVMSRYSMHVEVALLHFERLFAVVVLAALDVLSFWVFGS